MEQWRCPGCTRTRSAISDVLVRNLLAAQYPHVAGRPLARLATWGTDHVIFRLGDDLSVRLPKIAWTVGQGELESQWLPALAPRLPVRVPVPVFVGSPADGYPHHWYIAPWIEGDNPHIGNDLNRLACDVAAVVLALQSVDASRGPQPTGSQRGGPLAHADTFTRTRAQELRGETDVDGLLAAWDLGMRAPTWDGPPR